MVAAKAPKAVPTNASLTGVVEGAEKMGAPDLQPEVPNTAFVMVADVGANLQIAQSMQPVVATVPSTVVVAGAPFQTVLPTHYMVASKVCATRTEAENVASSRVATKVRACLQTFAFPTVVAYNATKKVARL